MAEPTSCCAVPGGYCARVDALFNLPGVHVTDVGWRADRTRNLGDRLVLTVETGPLRWAVRVVGSMASRSRPPGPAVHDIPAFGAPVELLWRVRRYRCVESACQAACSPRNTTWPWRGRS